MRVGTGLRTVYTAAGINNPETLSNRQKTQYIYSLIREHKYSDAIEALQAELEKYPKSRPALSLLAYCHFHSQNFIEASNFYEQLVRLHPLVEQYRVSYAQSLLSAGLYPEAGRVVSQIKHPQFEQTALHLKLILKYEQDELGECGTLLDQCLPGDAQTLMGWGCLKYKVGEFEKAKSFFQDAMNQAGYLPTTAYNIGLCNYRLNEDSEAMKHIDDIIARGAKEHPELSVGSRTEGSECKSVGNSSILEGTQLIQAFNLKAAIQFKEGNLEGCKESLTDLPPRSEQELDPITLQNEGLMRIELDQEGSFKKLRYLLSNPPFPPETFQNLLDLYIKYDFVDEAADILAENSHLHHLLTRESFDYLEARIIASTDPVQGFERFDQLSSKHIDTLRRITKKINDANLSRDHKGYEDAHKEFEEALDIYMPVLMSMAKIYWDRENFEKVEKIFRESSALCADHPIWKLNVAHTFFMQHAKFKEAKTYYEQIMKSKGAGNILNVTPIILGNLCVSYIMTSQNEIAEDIMKQIETEEGQVWDPEKPIFHFCIVNLVIGTLYCSKGNYEFGLQRIMKCFEPLAEKLSSDTWFYAKRCFLAHLEGLAKHMFVAKDDTVDSIMDFLEGVGEAGKEIYTIPANDPNFDSGVHNVFAESRLLRYMYLKLRD